MDARAARVAECVTLLLLAFMLAPRDALPDEALCLRDAPQEWLDVSAAFPDANIDPVEHVVSRARCCIIDVDHHDECRCTR